MDIGLGEMKSTARWEKGSKPGVGGMIRRGVKKGGRLWMDLKKCMGVNRTQLAVAVLFLLCVALIVFLIGGDGEDGGAAVSAGMNVVEEVALPNVRVNPTLLKKAKERAAMFSEKEDRESGASVTRAVEGDDGGDVGVGEVG